MEPLYLFVKSLKYLNQLARFGQISTSFRPKHVAVIENEIPAEELCQTASLCVTWLMKTDLTDVFCKKAQLVQTNLYNWFGHFKDVHISIIGSPVHISLLTAMCQTHIHTHTHTHTHPFNGPLSGSTQVSWYHKGKTNLDFTEARDSEWQWHQLGHNYASLHLASDR